MMPRKRSFLKGGPHLPASDGKLRLTLLAVSSFIIFKPGMALTAVKQNNYSLFKRMEHRFK